VGGGGGEFPLVVIPEPAGLLLMLAGAVLLGLAPRKRAA
jgi:hypothetical protein